jgi:predicted DNA-binding transcriptional regulator AlpA
MQEPNTQTNEDDFELWSIETVCRYFGGTKPLNPSSIYRGIKLGIYPPSRKVGPNSRRWLPSECRAARNALLSNGQQRGVPTHEKDAA